MTSQYQLMKAVGIIKRRGENGNRHKGERNPQWLSRPIARDRRLEQMRRTGSAQARAHRRLLHAHRGEWLILWREEREAIKPYPVLSDDLKHYAVVMARSQMQAKLVLTKRYPEQYKALYAEAKAEIARERGPLPGDPRPER